MRPGEIARHWAERHPDERGAIVIVSVVPKGRGGRRGTTERRSLFYVKDGEARASRRQRVDEYGWYGHDHAARNGYCYRCGRLYLEPVLRCYYVERDDAGQEVEIAHLSQVGMVYAPYGCAYICPECVIARDVAPNEFVDHRLPELGNHEYVDFLGGGSNGVVPIATIMGERKA